jgi:copper(I)-binding protein
MLMNLKSTLNVGDKINIDLRFEGHDPISVPVEVK